LSLIDEIDGTEAQRLRLAHQGGPGQGRPTQSSRILKKGYDVTHDVTLAKIKAVK